MLALVASYFTVEINPNLRVTAGIFVAVSSTYKAQFLLAVQNWKQAQFNVITLLMESFWKKADI